MRKLHIKYMVDEVSRIFVSNELVKLGLHITNINFCEVDIMEKISLFQISKIQKTFQQEGLELIFDKRTIIVEKIKAIIVDMIENKENIKVNFSIFLSKKLKRDYTYLSNIFSDIEGITIEHFIILYKIETIKKMIISDELNISEISYLMRYSSVPHLCNQFKKVTGITTSEFKKIVEKDRINSRIDNKKLTIENISIFNKLSVFFLPIIQVLLTIL